jgi:hypothetical protein
LADDYSAPRPIESGDKNTQAVFGDYIDVYDILQSKEDKATVPIYYEAWLAKIDLKPEERPKIDPMRENPFHHFPSGSKPKLLQSDPIGRGTVRKGNLSSAIGLPAMLARSRAERRRIQRGLNSWPRPGTDDRPCPGPAAYAG